MPDGELIVHQFESPSPGGRLLLFRVYSITWGSTNDKLTEFRFEADSEGHGVPDRTLFLALNEVSG